MIKNYVTLIVCFSAFSISAQSTYLSSGGDILSPDGFISYAVGQVMYSYNTGANGSIHEGVQQPFELLETLGTPNKTVLNSQLYPNPTRNVLNIKFENNEAEKAAYKLFDLHGRLIKRGVFTNHHLNTLHLDELSSGQYVLQLINRDKTIKTYKIIKH